MRCPHCDATSNRVVDTRASRGGRAVRRRRECVECGTRFTTYEYLEERPRRVLKAAGHAEDFDRDKLIRSIAQACGKRPVSDADLDRLVEDVEEALSTDASLEVSTRHLSEMVMNRLRALDRVAYVRYASVYRNFRDLDEFQAFVSDVRARQRTEELNRDQVELEFQRIEADGAEGQPQG